MLNPERAAHWLNVGAQPSETVAKLLKKAGVSKRPGRLAWRMRRWARPASSSRSPGYSRRPLAVADASMRIDVLTLFPEAIEPFFATSIVGRAAGAGLVRIVCTNFRDFAADKHRSVDDKPFGGGAGMVLMPGADVTRPSSTSRPRTRRRRRGSC